MGHIIWSELWEARVPFVVYVAALAAAALVGAFWIRVRPTSACWPSAAMVFLCGLAVRLIIGVGLTMARQWHAHLADYQPDALGVWLFFCVVLGLVMNHVQRGHERQLARHTLHVLVANTQRDVARLRTERTAYRQQAVQTNARAGSESEPGAGADADAETAAEVGGQRPHG